MSVLAETRARSMHAEHVRTLRFRRMHALDHADDGVVRAIDAACWWHWLAADAVRAEHDLDHQMSRTRIDRDGKPTDA